MNQPPMDNAPLTPGPDWTSAKPEHMPLPTIWPAALGLGSALLCWGLISSWIISAVGLVLFTVAMVGWVGDIRHERATQ